MHEDQARGPTQPETEDRPPPNVPDLFKLLARRIAQRLVAESQSRTSPGIPETTNLPPVPDGPRQVARRKEARER